jgi:hypothetical protein
VVVETIPYTYYRIILKVMTTSTTTGAGKNNDVKVASTVIASASVSRHADKEERLRQSLERHLQPLCSKNKPLDKTYKHLLARSRPSTLLVPVASTALPGVVVPPSAAKTAGSTSTPVEDNHLKLYKKVNAELRLAVETYMASSSSSSSLPEKRKLEDGLMRTALTLREWKEHEQKHLLKKFLNSGGFAARNTMSITTATTPSSSSSNNKAHIIARQKQLESTALFLQQMEEKEYLQRINKKRNILMKAEEKKKKKSTSSTTTTSRTEDSRTSPSVTTATTTTTTTSSSTKEKERLLALQQQRQQARERERQRELRIQLEEEERRVRVQQEKEEAERKARLAETPRQALKRLYEPMFQSIWNMEFSNLHNTNPFRIVLNEENCAMMGVPDYCQVVTKPMNLTYIQTKVNQCHYETLQEFFADLELMIQNSFLYNSDPTNPYHIATKELRKQFKKMAKNLLSSIQQQPSSSTS